jgi:TolB-like protein/Flp pilus assembly protein TadD
MMNLGPAHLDLEKRQLTLGDRTVALQSKPFLVLEYLIENRHRVVTRKELLDRFWEGKEVYDESLSKAVGSIRKALGETRDSSIFIETRWGLGYRYVGLFGGPPAPGSKGETGNLLAHVANGSSGHRPLEEVPESFAGALSESDGPPFGQPTGQPTPTASQSFLHRLKIRPKSWRAFLLIGVGMAAVLAIGLGYRSAFKAKTAAATTSVSTRSIAVLPFTADAGNQEDRYLGLGLANAVADRLATVPQLGVRSSTTVRSILGPDPDPASAGGKLEVTALVTGNVRRVADKVVISVQLLDTSAGKTLWSGSFNSDSNSFFATEDAISQQVASALLPQFGANVLKPSSAPDTAHPEAYAKYMQAEFFATTRTQTSLAKAIDLLNSTIQIDPNYARAYAALADCYQLQGFYEFAPPAEAYPRAETAALKALSLDNSLVEAHVSLLSALADYDHDWRGVEREFKAAAASDPNYAAAYQYYGFALLGMGRGEEALVSMKHAAQLDPVSPSVQTSLAWGYYLLRQNEQAVDQCNRVLERYPDFVPAHQLLGEIYGQMRLSDRATAELNLARKLERDSKITPILIDYELARDGRQEEAARDLTDTMAKARGASLPDYYLAAAWTAIGDKAQAEAALDRAIKAHSNWVVYLAYDPRFDGLRPDPQFKSLLNRIPGSQNSPDASQRARK